MVSARRTHRAEESFASALLSISSSRPFTCDGTDILLISAESSSSIHDSSIAPLSLWHDELFKAQTPADICHPFLALPHCLTAAACKLVLSVNQHIRNDCFLPVQRTVQGVGR
ncbi:hypothetical protein CYLTODRAFT_51154 [Cylindrobasidium torrendii FP15055 ss-10]|uniref:Uncharacterized protein n=1 Tax=Cylindrobasidium torrendii FP15055 ss-10 TaxID=1314674 RepID=A0A0D7B5P7_9AGAR|nr:hypothetical protein CYLTODRAFT_51154 [Cylindrobasidium torrendii FP15055 ss-10]